MDYQHNEQIILNEVTRSNHVRQILEGFILRRCEQTFQVQGDLVVNSKPVYWIIAFNYSDTEDAKDFLQKRINLLNNKSFSLESSLQQVINESPPNSPYQIELIHNSELNNQESIDKLVLESSIFNFIFAS